MDSTSPSDTAILIARSILLAAKDPALSAMVAPGEEEVIRLMLGKKASGGWFGMVSAHTWGRRCLMFAERFLLGGIFAHYLARKRWIEKEARRGIGEGVRQVIVLGAGYDSLAWRLHEEFPHVEFFEVDHPATQASKRLTLGRPERLHFLPADLEFDLPEKVVANCSHFSGEEPSIVIAEGLTMYFDREKVATLLGSSSRLAGPRGNVIFTFMAADDDGSIRFRGESPAVGWWLRLRKEPFRWGIRRGDLSAFLIEHGLDLRTVADHRDLKSSLMTSPQLADVSLARGECLCICTPSLA